MDGLDKMDIVDGPSGPLGPHIETSTQMQGW
jgi:hypothetical protein